MSNRALSDRAYITDGTYKVNTSNYANNGANEGIQEVHVNAAFSNGVDQFGREQIIVDITDSEGTTWFADAQGIVYKLGDV